MYLSTKECVILCQHNKWNFVAYAASICFGSDGFAIDYLSSYQIKKVKVLFRCFEKINCKDWYNSFQQKINNIPV